MTFAYRRHAVHGEQMTRHCWLGVRTHRRGPADNLGCRGRDARDLRACVRSRLQHSARNDRISRVCRLSSLLAGCLAYLGNLHSSSNKQVRGSSHLTH